MNLHNTSAEIYVPDGLPEDNATTRTTHMGIGAHQDDIELIALHGILECFGKDDQHFMGVTVTDGAGSPRAGSYKSYTDDEMQMVRRLEQKKAASIGEYCAQAFLDYPSSAVKDGGNKDVIHDLKKILSAARPQVVYTHNPADKHDTHVGVAIKVIQAIRELPKDARPERIYGCEAWRDLDWLSDEDKIVFDVGHHENLSAALMGVFDSQISGGKRYDLAATGRMRANATFFASHKTDTSTGLIYGIDLTPLISDVTLDICEYIQSLINRFAEDVSDRIARLTQTG